jgi:hypothetical protein
MAGVPPFLLVLAFEHVQTGTSEDDGHRSH